jgi:hydroxymethylglutaryl-CoA synthase
MSDHGTDGENAGTDANGVRAVGAYAPRHRLPASEVEAAWGSVQASGVGRKAVPGADEDALTMAAAAATNALHADGTDGGSVGLLAFATTTPPLEEEDVSVRLGSMLGVPESARHEVYGASTRAGTRALAAGFDASLDDGEVALVVAADCPKGEPSGARDQAAGAGAVAFVAVDGGPGVPLARGSFVRPTPGTRFRERGSERVDGLGVTSYDRAAFTETLAGAVANLGTGSDEADPGVSDDVGAAAVQAPDGAMPYRATDALGVGTDAIQRVATVHDIGDTGAASALLGLGKALADPDVERALVAGYGSGAGADAFVVDVDGAVPASLALERDDERELSYAQYLRLRDEVVPDPPSGGGAYVSVPAWRRTLSQRHRLVAGRCEHCSALAFPPEGACVDCGSLDDYEHVELPGTGTVEAATTISQGGAPPEFALQQQRDGDFDVVVVAFDAPQGDDGAVSAPAQMTDVDAGNVAVGDDVVATVRRIYTQEGVTRYGFKLRPVRDR